MPPKEPISAEIVIEAQWQAWLAVVAVAVALLFAAVMPPLIRNTPLDAFLRDCPALSPSGTAYGPVCF